MVSSKIDGLAELAGDGLSDRNTETTSFGGCLIFQGEFLNVIIASDCVARPLTTLVNVTASFSEFSCSIRHQVVHRARCVAPGVFHIGKHGGNLSSLSCQASLGIPGPTHRPPVDASWAQSITTRIQERGFFCLAKRGGDAGNMSGTPRLFGGGRLRKHLINRCPAFIRRSEVVSGVAFTSSPDAP